MRIELFDTGCRPPYGWTGGVAVGLAHKKIHLQKNVLVFAVILVTSAAMIYRSLSSSKNNYKFL